MRYQGSFHLLIHSGQHLAAFRSKAGVQRGHGCDRFRDCTSRRGAVGSWWLVVGEETSTQFPKGLTEFRRRQGVGMKVNLLVNCGWEWHLAGLKTAVYVPMKFHVWI
jgi:hypothetical protein